MFERKKKMAKISKIQNGGQCGSMKLGRDIVSFVRKIIT